QPAPGSPFLAAALCSVYLPGNKNHIPPKEAQFNTTYSDWVHANLLNIYAFNHSVRRNRTEGVRVSVNVLSDQKDQPVLFVVRQKEAVVSFQVPLILRGLYQRKYAYQEVSRTLCQPQTKAEVETQHFYVDVSTLSLNTSYQLRVTRVENFVLRTNERFSFNATAAQPQVRQPAQHGTGGVCTHRGAWPPWHQQALCLLNALLGSADPHLLLQKKDFPSHSFYVVVVVKTEDEACGGALPYYPLSKNSSPGLQWGCASPTEGLSWLCTAEAYVRSVLFCLGIFLSFYILTLLIACWESCHSRSIPNSFLNHGPYDSYGYGSFGECHALSPVPQPCPWRSLENVAGRPRLDSLSSVEEDDYDTLADIDYDKNVIRTKQYLCVADLARKDKRVLRKKYQIYFWNIATIAVFYALPVIQLVITYQTVVNVTGNQDICYYNFLCAHPLGNLSAFNNILSNLGYVLLGLLFLLIILQREINYNRALLRNDAHALECGIPKHFGLFYAMGTALMMEGLLSACYHVCPNYTNFQFDTSFMYMIAGLCMLKLYQKRHPDINASAYSAYACLALVIFFSVVGVVFGKGNTAFWIVFSVIHIVATLLLSTQLYYMGRWKLDSGILRRILHVLYTDCVRQCSGPMYVDRMVLLVMGNIINWSLAAYGLIVRPNDFASYLLAIGICNLLLYFAFYIIMKLRSGERIKLIPLLCIISTSVVWGFALFFFFQGLSTWQKTPAESREHNRDCILLDFFDDHDIWHFLSSIAMFGSFLVGAGSAGTAAAVPRSPVSRSPHCPAPQVLLTLDDDLDCVQRDKIYVF
uniref:SID1 transmembrane family member 2 n=1 Tax=Junco hyemalis TaxID=40217 RepID=A0A8C5J1K9_JUNHY